MTLGDLRFQTGERFSCVYDFGDYWFYASTCENAGTRCCWPPRMAFWRVGYVREE